MNKTISRLIIICLILLIVVPFPQKINLTYEGLSTRDNENFENVNVHLDGMLYRFLFFENIFSGNLYITSKDRPKPYGSNVNIGVGNSLLGFIRKSRTGNRIVSTIAVTDDNPNKIYSLSFSSFHAPSNLSWINFYVPSYTYEIYAPAKTKEDVALLIEKRDKLNFGEDVYWKRALR